MKLAASLYYGSQLIDAESCDYVTYKELGLLCPHCKEAVFWQAFHERQAFGKIVQVPAHFKHFKHKDAALVKICEARVAQYDQAEIQKRATQARNQRLKLFQRHFWNIIRSYYEEFHRFPMSDCIAAAREQDFLVKITAYLVKLFEISELKEMMKEVASNMLNTIVVEGAVVCVTGAPEKAESGVVLLAEVQRYTRDKLASELHLDMQKLICSEIIDFLKSRSATPILHSLFLLAVFCLFDSINDGGRLGFVGNDGEDLLVTLPNGSVGVSGRFWDIPRNRSIFYHHALHHVILMASLVPWADRLNALTKQKYSA